MSVRVSVVIPVYNAAKFLPRCIDSVLCQSFKDFELILVDDGSSDDSPAVCSRYADVDPRVKVVRQENAGASMARAKGFEHSGGEWITFVDSDDTITPDAIEKMVSVAESLKCDIVVGEWQEVHADGSVNPLPLSVGGRLTSDAYVGALLGLRCDVGPVGKLFRRSLFDRSVFEMDSDIVRNEDLIMNLRIATRARSVEVCPRMLVYHYRHNDTSATTKCNSIVMWDKVALAADRALGGRFGTEMDKYLAMVLFGLFESGLLRMEEDSMLARRMRSAFPLKKRCTRFYFVSKYIITGNPAYKMGVHTFRVLRRVRLNVSILRMRLFGVSEEFSR